MRGALLGPVSALLALTIVCIGCAGGGGAAATTGATGAAAPAATEAAVGGGETTGGAGAGGTGAGGSGDGEAEAAAPEDRLIVRTGRMTLEVDSVAQRFMEATSVVEGAGGYVAGSEQEDDEGSLSASLVLRIPAESWDATLERLRGLAQRLISEQTSADEVTDQVVDLEARIANLRTSEAALQAIMARAGEIEDVLEVQRELTSVRGEIERLTAQAQNLQGQAAHGTLTLVLVPPTVAVVEEAASGWDLGREVEEAVVQLVRVGQALASLGIWLGIVVLPVVLPLVVLAWLASRLYRRWTAARPPRPRDALWGPGAGAGSGSGG